MSRFYLDDNATTSLDPQVCAVMEPLLAGTLGNPSSLHAEGRRARGEIDSARDSLAAWLKAKPSEIIFTSGGTESCNLAVQGLACAHGGKGKHLITAKTEHHAVLHACRAFERWKGFEVTWTADGWKTKHTTPSRSLGSAGHSADISADSAGGALQWTLRWTETDSWLGYNVDVKVEADGKGTGETHS